MELIGISPGKVLSATVGYRCKQLSTRRHKPFPDHLCGCGQVKGDMAADTDHLVVKLTVLNVTEPPAVYRYWCSNVWQVCVFACQLKSFIQIWLRASAGRDFFFLMTLRVPLIHYVDISRRHSHKCVCTIMVINVQNQQFSASPNSSNVTNLAYDG